MTSLSGSIPGLLRRCSPVVLPDGHRGVVIYVSDDGVWCLVASGSGVKRHGTDTLRLDLTDPTGQARAAAWLRSAYEGALRGKPRLDAGALRALGHVASRPGVDAAVLRSMCLAVVLAGLDGGAP